MQAALERSRLAAALLGQPPTPSQEGPTRRGANLRDPRRSIRPWRSSSRARRGASGSRMRPVRLPESSRPRCCHALEGTKKTWRSGVRRESTRMRHEQKATRQGLGRRLRRLDEQAGALVLLGHPEPEEQLGALARATPRGPPQRAHQQRRKISRYVLLAAPGRRKCRQQQAPRRQQGTADTGVAPLRPALWQHLRVSGDKMITHERIHRMRTAHRSERAQTVAERRAERVWRLESRASRRFPMACARRRRPQVHPPLWSQIYSVPWPQEGCQVPH